MGGLAIKAEGVRFSYPNGTEALKGVWLTIWEGERFALLGPNGAGKSTFLLLLNGLLLPTGGRLLVMGVEVKKENRKRLREIVGLVFQDPEDQLFMPTVLEDVAFGPLNMGLSREEAEVRAKEALSMVGLEGLEERHPHHLSAGEKRRAALASVLSMNPKILALDEPTANLDVRGIKALMEALRKFEGTVIVATHDVEFARRVCQKAAILESGKVIAQGPMEEIALNKGLLRDCGLAL
ncbi:MAG TPA: ABC transporter ATP-binding protein [Armatimonadetes bacterium]|nr:ABC transporter ATP-binding protein [Armatimonadota bacterium]